MRPVRSIAATLLLAIGLLAASSGPAHAATASVVATIDVGTAPWGVVFSPDGSRAYVANSGSDTISVIDVDARALVSTISTGAGTGPSGMSVTPDGSKALATLTGTDQLASIATSTLSVTTAAAGCTQPRPITMRNDGTGAYIGCSNGEIRHAATSNLATTSTANWTDPIPDVALVPTDITIAFTVHAVLADTFALVSGNVISTLTSQGLSIAVNAAGTRAYVGQANGTLSVYRVSAPFGLDHTIPVGGQLSGVALTPDGTQAFVVDKANNLVKVVDLVTRQVVQTIVVGSSPQRIAISSNGRMALVTNNGSNTASLIALPLTPFTPASGENVPTAAMQQFGRTEGQTCDVAPDDLADFPALGMAVRNDAWGMSWAQWPNGGTGGFVCTRQPYYTNAGTWAVR